MRLLTSATMVAATVLAAPAAVAADNTFETFKALCLDNAGKPAESLLAAEALGWTPAPPSRVEAIFKDAPTLGTITGREGRTAPGGQRSVVVGRAVSQKVSISTDACVLAAPDADAVALIAEARRYAGFPPAMSDKTAALYVWRESAEGRKALTATELQNVKSNAGLTIMGVGKAAIGTTVVLMAPTK